MRLQLPALVVGVIVSHAGTTIAGGSIKTQSWTAAGSPYLIKGDVTVPAGVTLTIEPGAIVQMAARDALAAGNDGDRVEIIVSGTLIVGGAGSPVTIES